MGEAQPVKDVDRVLEAAHDGCALDLVPTRGGTTARVISRCKPAVWSIAPTRASSVCQGLAFSYGIHAVDLPEEPEDWREFAAAWLAGHGLTAKRVMLIAGPSSRNPNANHRIELMQLDRHGESTTAAG